MKAIAENLSEPGEVRYNAIEKRGHESGYMGEGNPKAACIYSVYKIENGIAFCQYNNAWGQTRGEAVPIENLEPYEGKRS